MKSEGKIIVEKMIKLANKNLYAIIEEFEKAIGMEFEIGCNQDLDTLLKMMHSAVDLVVPIMNEAQKEVKEDLECTSIQE